ncbi:prephenate dehydrogenase [Roseimaritima sediminicola]|uniref:prephenate dehydrogenase n=1 Tax=Roseimaritima sediminicola TaxID=2662066 RepID=UPI00129826A7|nr:prephenate dehydrogenase [Roseimaritima sediminicola]
MTPSTSASADAPDPRRTAYDESFPAPAKAAIVGVGLLGGSIGLALRRRWPEIEVWGTSRNEARRRLAVETGCVTRAVADPAAACRDADLVFVCTPVGKIAQHCTALAAACPSRTLLTDVGSTKRQLVAQIEQDPRAAAMFVGSHPIAGGERTGPGHARADLFQGKRVVVTPTAQTDPARLRQAVALWQTLGSEVLQMSPETHDRLLAGISHATHFASCAVASILRPDELPLVGSGWRDTTRVAAGDPQMWNDIAMQNAGPISQRLGDVREALDRLIAAIDSGDSAALLQLLTEAQTLRKSLPAASAEHAPRSGHPENVSAARTDPAPGD